MKKILSVFTAAAVTFAVTGCGGKNDSGMEISTQENTAKMTGVSSSETVTSVSSVSSDTAETTVTTSYAEYVRTTDSISTDVTTAVSNSVHVAESTHTSAETTEKSTSPASTTESETTTSAETTESHHTHEKSEIIKAYEEAVSQKIDMMLESDYDSVSVSYTLFDMDSDGIPELIVKCGTSDDDFQNTFYTYDDFGIKVISDGTASGHSGFAHDTETGAFVSAYCEKGTAVLNWLSYDGSDIEIVNSCEFEYSGEVPYEIQAEDFGVEWLPFACFTKTNDTELTWIYRVVNHGLEYDEINGKDFGFLYNFEF